MKISFEKYFYEMLFRPITIRVMNKTEFPIGKVYKNRIVENNDLSAKNWLVKT